VKIEKLFYTLQFMNWVGGDFEKSLNHKILRPTIDFD